LKINKNYFKKIVKYFIGENLAIDLINMRFIPKNFFHNIYIQQIKCGFIISEVH